MTEVSSNNSSAEAGHYDSTNNAHFTPRSYTVSDVLSNLTVRAVVELVQRVLAAPIDRVATLTAVEGELKRQGRLPTNGFGGVTGCFSQVWRTEGPGGMLRGVFSSAALALPAMFIDNMAINLVYTGMHMVLPGLYNEETVTPLRAMAGTQAVLYLASWIAVPYNAARRTILTNYMSDIVSATPVRVTTAAVTSKTQSTCVTAVGSTTESGSVHREEREKEEEVAGANSVVSAVTCSQKEIGSAVPVKMYQFDSACHVVSVLFQRGGWRAFYRSIAVEPLTLFMFRGLYFMAVLTIPDRTMQAYPQLIRRGLAVITAVITQPLEVIDRRLMLSAASDDPERQYTGVMDCARRVVREEGVTVLWSGLKFRLALTGVSIAATMLYHYFAS